MKRSLRFVCLGEQRLQLGQQSSGFTAQLGRRSCLNTALAVLEGGQPPALQPF
ncbi:hypothetical protein [Teichococcus oryzae]|uniref:hypothetical protein n=1 Tax=Teichococcus oryzae TaxID=1608942 RepID=UPI0013757EBC|nr:hypothetical protein [Pseudoroseomonas oryzae]